MQGGAIMSRVSMSVLYSALAMLAVPVAGWILNGLAFASLPAFYALQQLHQPLLVHAAHPGPLA